MVGKRVDVEARGEGVLMFFGNVQFNKDSKWCGVALDEPQVPSGACCLTWQGKNDGSVDGVRYFECPPNHGIFVHQDKVTLLDGTQKKPSRASPQPQAGSGKTAPNPAPKAGTDSAPATPAKDEAKVEEKKKTETQIEQIPAIELAAAPTATAGPSR